MKKSTYMSMLCLFLIFQFSCSSDQDFLDAVLSEELGEEAPNENNEDASDQSDNDPPSGNTNGGEIPANFPGDIVINTTPCDYDLNILEPNGILAIDCQLDLEGASINLPNNVTLEFNGGEIINGSLNFSGGLIDGRLLNKNLEVKGEVSLTDPTFYFYPKRWDVVQGQTTSDVALVNTRELERLIFYSKDLGATTFVIDEFDAYFEVGKVTSTTNHNFYPTIEAINIPENFNFVMTENTHLRVFPNNAPKYSLLAVRDVANVTITGGNLYGERDAHDYSSGGTHEHGHALDLHAAVNVTVSGVKMSNGTGDGMYIHSLYFTFQDDRYRPSNNILVTDCVFDSNRRNNLSITDGFDIIIENNLFLNAGVDTPNSTGTAPKFGIDVEAARESDGNGGYIFYERAENILIRNNTERGSAAGAMTIHIGYYVTIEGNTTEKGIGFTYTNGSIIRNNTVDAGSSEGIGAGIKGGKTSTTGDSIYDNEIYGNTIIGYNTGINVSNRDVKVYDNFISQCKTGIFLLNIRNSQINSNEISSQVPGSNGIVGQITSLDNIEIFENEVDVVSDAIKMVKVNEDLQSNNFLVRDNIFNSNSRSNISLSSGLNFINNSFNHTIRLTGSTNINVQDNLISSGNSVGIDLREGLANIQVMNNEINTSNSDCITVDPTSANEVSLTNNQCLN
ncbi:right-handed parallel beta-helix repeat-containing protein [Muriicola soli]|uniref:Right handed beta helix domain-containing protein n=1 Tax=Muriicola soli TaxID=2507538 RepID=A0A411E8M6_9FLAO|nr:right-handed parallel beta-helix repeat-containing protein [Muriicola soli]QBA63884.1 hypothetical protein EQY75_04630 [Muriicola soli]